MENILKSGERLDDLEYDNLKIIQHPDGYCFTSDSVLLANLTNIKRGDRVVDLCTGSGVVAILIAGKFHPSVVYGVELQERLADMAARSVELNKLENTVKIINARVQGVNKTIGNNFDAVVVNPPYDEPISEENATEKDICRREIFLNIEETVVEAEKLLKFGGLFYMVNRVRKLADVIFFMKKYGLEPKKIILVQPKTGKNIDTFIVEGKKGAKPSLIVPEPLVVYDDDGNMTEKVRRLYNK